MITNFIIRQDLPSGKSMTGDTLHDALYIRARLFSTGYADFGFPLLRFISFWNIRYFTRNCRKNQSVFTEFTRALLYIIATIAHLCTKNCLSYIQTNFSCFQALELGLPTIYFSHQRMPWHALQA